MGSFFCHRSVNGGAGAFDVLQDFTFLQPYKNENPNEFHVEEEDVLLQGNIYSCTTFHQNPQKPQENQRN